MLNVNVNVTIPKTYHSTGGYGCSNDRSVLYFGKVPLQRQGTAI